MLVTIHKLDFRLSLLLTFPNKCYWGLFDASPKFILPAFFIPGTYVKTKGRHSFIILEREFINDNFTKTDYYLKIHFRVKRMDCCTKLISYVFHAHKNTEQE